MNKPIARNPNDPIMIEEQGQEEVLEMDNTIRFRQSRDRVGFVSTKGVIKPRQKERYQSNDDS